MTKTLPEFLTLPVQKLVRELLVEQLLNQIAFSCGKSEFFGRNHGLNSISRDTTDEGH